MIGGRMIEVMRGIDSLIGDYVVVVGAVMLIIGAIQCFLGYKLLKLWTAICGFVVGAGIGVILPALLLKSAESALVGIAAFIGFFIGGILGVWLSFKLYLVGVFFTVASFTGLAGYLLTQSWVAALVLAIVVGIVAVKFVRPVIIISTAFSGGITCGYSLALVLQQQNNVVMPLLLCALFIAGGIFVQFKTTVKHKNGSSLGGGVAALYCSSCGKKYEGAQSFCSSCGATTAKNNVTTCQNCGAATANGPGSRCIQCGARQQSGQVTVPPVAANSSDTEIF